MSARRWRAVIPAEPDHDVRAVRDDRGTVWVRRQVRHTGDWLWADPRGDEWLEWRDLILGGQLEETEPPNYNGGI